MSKLKERPEWLPSKTAKIETAVGTAFITMTFDDEGPAEVFVNVGKAGSESFAISEALGRLISTILRLSCLGTPQERLAIVIDQLEGIGGTPTGRNVRSVPDAVAYVLKGGVDEFESSSEGSPSGM